MSSFSAFSNRPQKYRGEILYGRREWLWARGALEIGIDELALLKQPPDVALAVIIQSFIPRLAFKDGFRVFRRNELDERENDRISFRQDILVKNHTIFAR